MDSPFAIILYYLIANIAVVVGHKIEPTNLAGPGLEMILYPIFFITSLILLMRVVLGKINHGKSLMPGIILHLLGITSLILLVLIPFWLKL